MNPKVGKALDVQSRLAHQIELDAASTGQYSFNGPKSGPPPKSSLQYVQAHLSGIDLSPRRWRHCISPRQGPSEREPSVRLRPDGSSVEGRIFYRGPRAAPVVTSLKLDLTAQEKVVRPTVLREINHQYPDAFPAPGTVRCYGFEEVFAEKMRAMGQRSRPRDLYDIINLFRRVDVLPHSDLVRSVYEEKCRSKELPVFDFGMLESSPFRVELESEWANMLAHQLPALPPFEEFWSELPNLFDWLNGRAQPADLPSITSDGWEEPGWSPPSVSWTWGQGVPFETVRFAAANHLCVELGYNGEVRGIEPYSLRRTRDGSLLLYGVRVDDGGIRSYRVDRITSVRVMSTPLQAQVQGGAHCHWQLVGSSCCLEAQAWSSLWAGYLSP